MTPGLQQSQAAILLDLRVLAEMMEALHTRMMEAGDTTCPTTWLGAFGRVTNLLAENAASFLD